MKYSARKHLLTWTRLAAARHRSTEMRQRLPSAPLREDANTSSRLSAVQVMPFISWRSEREWVAGPPAARTTNISDASADTSRMKAIHLPSGENSGYRSLCDAVISRRWLESSDSRKMPPDSGSSEDDAGPRGRCASASVLPSGDQETPCQPSAILRSLPPSAGTI